MSRLPFVVGAAVSAGCLYATGPQHMWIHFDAAADAHYAVLQGDMELARQAGWRLAEHGGVSGLPDGSDSVLAQMRWYASQVAEAVDISEAAFGTAGVARMCGECHATYQTGPVFGGGGAPPVEGSGVNLEMRRHSWAAARMWEGLIGPSDSAWVVGARLLLDAPMASHRITERANLQPNVGTMERRVHELGRRAVVVTDAEERARLYADVASTCAGCHVLVR